MPLSTSAALVTLAFLTLTGIDMADGDQVTCRDRGRERQSGGELDERSCCELKKKSRQEVFTHKPVGAERNINIQSQTEAAS